MGAQPAKIMVVDDESHIATAVTLALGRGFEIEPAADGQEAFEILRKNWQGISVVVVDHMMPGWAGSELIKRLQVAGFRGKCIVLSGYLSREVESVYASLGVEYILPKPFDVERLRSAVRESLRSIEDQRN